jgi:hypothetical protein
VIPERPEVALFAYCRARQREVDIIFLVWHLANLLQNQVDLRNLEARDRNVEISLDRQKMLQFDRKDRLIPLSIQSQPVIGNYVMPVFGLGSGEPAE